MSFDLSGKVALVTGGGRGIGAAIVTRFAEAGARVVIANRTLDVAQELAASLTGRGFSVEAVPLGDLMRTSLTSLVDDTASRCGSLEIVVHTAGGVSDPFAFTIQGQAPAIFQSAGVVQVIRDDNNEPVTFTNPIHPNTIFTIYVTGLGLTTPLPPLGTLGSADPLPAVVNPPSVKLGGVSLAADALRRRKRGVRH